MSDTFQGAESSVDVQKRALLAAIAQQGAAAKEQYGAQAQAWGDTRSKAVSGAAERAGAIGAPADAVAQLQQSASSTLEPYAQDAWRATQAQDAENARMTTANANYMDQVRSAIPIARSVASARIAEVQAEAADRAAARAASRGAQSFAAEDQAFQRERMQWERDDRNAGSRPLGLVSVDDASDQLWGGNGLLGKAKVAINKKLATSDPGFASSYQQAIDDLAAGDSPEIIMAKLNAASWQAGNVVPQLIAAMLGLG